MWLDTHMTHGIQVHTTITTLTGEVVEEKVVTLVPPRCEGVATPKSDVERQNDALRSEIDALRAELAWWKAQQ